MTEPALADTLPGEEQAVGSTAPPAELLRALGALSVVPPPASDPISAALGLAAMTAADHTRLFVLDLPPYASIYLGRDGNLGGEAADRVAGMWRALGLDPPADPDHLATLLALYAELGVAAVTCRTAAARARLVHARSVLRAEHLVSWLDPYLTAAPSYPGAEGWARLCQAAMGHEPRRHADQPLPAALRDAPRCIQPTDNLDQLLDSLVTPIRIGFVLTHRDLQHAGNQIGLGVRRGERRYTLRAMLDQDPAATLGWLAGEARQWSTAYRRHPLDGATSRWWSARASSAAIILDTIATQAGPMPRTRGTRGPAVPTGSKHPGMTDTSVASPEPPMFTSAPPAIS